MQKIKKYILFTLIALFLLCIAFFALILFTGSDITIGRYLLSDSGDHLVADQTAPTVMHTKNDFMFRNLTPGDKILVVHGMTHTTYPGETGAYFCIKLADGKITDVPSKILLELYDMGWIGENEENFPYKFRKASYQALSASMTVIMPDTWDYEYVSAASVGEPHGIAFWPKAVSEGRIELLCYPYGYYNTNSPELKTRGIELLSNTINYMCFKFLNSAMVT